MTSESQASAVGGSKAPKSSGKVLLADDDEPFRRALSRRLERAGFHCDQAASATEAMNRLRENIYDVLLADINMPGNQGLELVRGVPAVAPLLPVVLLTGLPTVETAARSVKLKVAAYLVKPPAFDELCQVLAVAAREHRQMRLLEESRCRLQNWEQEVARLQRLLEQPAEIGRQTAMRSYLRLTLRNLVVGLVELESLLMDEPAGSGNGRLFERHELLAALRKTVGVLESTRGHFKSKELGELRKELEQLLS